MCFYVPLFPGIQPRLPKFSPRDDVKTSEVRFHQLDAYFAFGALPRTYDSSFEPVGPVSISVKPASVSRGT